jgi:hypothetical protein
MGIQFFVSLLKVISEYNILATDGSKIGEIQIIQGCWEKPVQFFLISIQYGIMSFSERV